MNARLILLLMLLAASGSPWAAAARYDGNYTVTYQVSGGNYGGPTQYSFSIAVRGGVVQGSRVHGTVSSGGDVSMTVSSMCGGATGTFTGTVAEGGTWSCSNNQGHGTWTMSGGGGGGGLPTDTASTEKFVAGAAAIVAGLVGLALVALPARAGNVTVPRTRASGIMVGRGQLPEPRPVLRGGGPQGFATSPAAPPRDLGPFLAADAPPPIGATEPAFAIRDRATTVGERNLPPPLKSFWVDPGKGLHWEAPEDPPLMGSELVGYRAWVLRYGPNATEPQPVWMGDVPAGVQAFQPPPLHTVQTYQFSTGGDIAGYRVEPLYRFVDGRYGEQVFPGMGAFRPWG